MRILICNDDGIQAKGINALRMRLEKEEKVKSICVVAPDRERSAIGHCITMHRPLRASKVHYQNSKSRGWSVDGTPADCVKLAVEELIDEAPDIILSGVNLGPNLGTDVIYSGTVSAAMEGVISGFPSAAISYTGVADADFTVAVEFAAGLIHDIDREGLPPGTLLNVNVPPGKPQGIKVVRLGFLKYTDIFDKRTDPRGMEYYWMAGNPVDQEEAGLDTDIEANRQGYISVTPVQIDLTNYGELERIKSWRYISPF